MPISNTSDFQLGDAQFGKAWRVTIDTMEVAAHTASGYEPDGHDISFKVEKTLKPLPNTCELTVFNLNEDQRAHLEQLAPKRIKGAPAKPSIKGVPVKIEAGYADNLSQIWLGDLRTVNTKRENTDWTTILESGDGEKAHQNARINVSFGPSTPMDTALRAMVRAMGVGEGNIGKVANDLSINGFGNIFSQGITLSGQASREITDFARSADLEWSIQDGAIQFLARGKALASRAILLSEDTGMRGSPTVDNSGIMTVKMAMIPDVRPGALLVLDAARLKGNYRIEKCTYVGSTFSNDWDITVQAKRY